MLGATSIASAWLLEPQEILGARLHNTPDMSASERSGEEQLQDSNLQKHFSVLVRGTFKDRSTDLRPGIASKIAAYLG